MIDPHVSAVGWTVAPLSKSYPLQQVKHRLASLAILLVRVIRVIHDILNLITIFARVCPDFAPKLELNAATWHRWSHWSCVYLFYYGYFIGCKRLLLTAWWWMWWAFKIYLSCLIFIYYSNEKTLLYKSNVICPLYKIKINQLYNIAEINVKSICLCRCIISVYFKYYQINWDL